MLTTLFPRSHASNFQVSSVTVISGHGIRTPAQEVYVGVDGVRLQSIQVE